MNSLFDRPFWGRGFRPFFFFGACHAALIMPLWVFIQQGSVTTGPDPLFWHAHEMVFGFTVSIISGFLLTAVANWTGGAPARQRHLAGLVFIWLMGRLCMFFPDMPTGATAFFELLYLPVLTISLAVPLWKSRNIRNFLFIGLLSALWTCDALSLFQHNLQAIHAAILIVITIIMVVGGRVIPAFTVAALRRRGIEAIQFYQPKADILSLFFGILTVICFSWAGANSWVTGVLALLAAGINLLRFYRFRPLQSLSDPMLWILHLGFLWMIIGLACLGLSSWGLIPFSLSLHALTAGAIGSLCIGMMCRVSLGHTGRPINADKAIVVAFALIQISAVLRTIGVTIWPDHHQDLVFVSGILWAIPFGIFIVRFSPILFSPRPDGSAA